MCEQVTGSFFADKLKSNMLQSRVRNISKVKNQILSMYSLTCIPRNISSCCGILKHTVNYEESGWQVKYFPQRFHVKTISTTGVCLKYNKSIHSNNQDNVDETDDDVEEDEEYDNFMKRYLRVDGHQVLVIQPYIKWGSEKKHNTSPQQQLLEAVALVHTLPNWKVVEKVTIPLRSFDKKTLFGSGNLKMLQDAVQRNKTITAIFISVGILRGLQQRVLEEIFHVPVYDKYTVIIQIFKEHAVTKEAKLQVSMAEIPYLWSRLRGMHEGKTDKLGGGVTSIGGAGETFIEARRRILANRESKLKQAIMKLRGQRELLRQKRQKLHYPVVAVVGYTNAGKTALIKALTGEVRLQPKDQLFATLDVTTHGGILPYNLNVLYVDTVGFISDIPASLIESFVATLEDAMIANVIVHVCDISHSDRIAQAENVTKTLESLNVSSTILENIITVGNKVDLVSNDAMKKLELENMIFVSAVKETGINALQEEIEEKLLKATGRFRMIMRVPMGGPEASWLHKEAAVSEVAADPRDNQYMLMKIVISESTLNKFKHRFT